MVSTRGVKLKFFDGERVLCYEPDPTKAKVLYDSKVLQVIVNKDQRGRKSVEYLIHFQGWNSSWDRCVSEDFVLKDTPENRQLQKDLADKAQLQLGAYLYRRERKKRKERKLSERITPSSEDGSSGSPALMDTDDAHTGVTTSSDSNSSGDEDIIPLELTSTLRHALEHDNYLINTKHKLLQLPAEPHVVAILEKYFKHYANRELSKISDRPNTRQRHSIYGNTASKNKPEHIHRNINTCKELVDGLRVYFDFTVLDLLLYNREREQVVTAQATELSICNLMKPESSSPDTVKSEPEDTEYAHLPPFDANRLSIEEKSDVQVQSSKRWLRSHRSVDSESNGSLHQDSTGATKADNSVSNAEVQTSTSRILNWSLIPEHVYNQDPPPPCLTYGATHLTRLLVKLPDLLYASNIPDDKLKALMRHLDSFIEFLSEHKEWFGDKYYVDSPFNN